MAESFKRHFLKAKETKQLLHQLQSMVKIDLQKLVGTHARIEIVESKTATFFLVNSKPLFVKIENLIFPTLCFKEISMVLPQIIVNMGAVSHVCNGADIMAPGVVQVKGNFKQNEFVVILDEHHQKPLAIGIALYDSETIKNMKHGKIVKNVHFIGDKIWHLLKNVKPA